MDFKTAIDKLDVDWLFVKNRCRKTVNKDCSDKEPTTEFKKNLLIAEHSPIRLIHINWTWDKIKHWITVHYVRHHVGVEPFVGTQRDDRTGIPRDGLPQSEPTNMSMEANPQSLINMAKVRLCYMAHKETRELMEDLKCVLHNIPETAEIANVMVPSCVYRYGCPEKFGNKTCKFWESLGSVPPDIQARYDYYNKCFYKRKGVLD
jgi:hypothetical protein